MFRGFNVIGLSEENFGSSFLFYEKIGRKFCSSYSAKAAAELNQFVIDGENMLDAVAIQKYWFPTYKNRFDIFISHSHNDESLAYAFAGWLKYKMGLNCFVDGEIWLSADGLIRQLDDLSQLEVDVYDYEKRNLSTSQIHAMLSVAIMEMINNCEALFFLNTPNSVPIETAINNLSLSPWLFLEIGISRIIEKKKNANRRRNVMPTIIEAAADLGYEMDLSHLTELDKRRLCEWRLCYRD